MASTSRTGNGNPRDLSQCGPNFVLRQSFILIGSTCIVGKKKYCCKGSRTHSNSSMTSTVSANVSMATASKEKQTVGVLYLSTQFYIISSFMWTLCVVHLYTASQNNGRSMPLGGWAASLFGFVQVRRIRGSQIANRRRRFVIKLYVYVFISVDWCFEISRRKVCQWPEKVLLCPCKTSGRTDWHSKENSEG